MTASKQNIIIKGTKDGLIFLLNDQCDYPDLLAELQHKLENTHQQFLNGPIVHVQVKLGNREASQEQKDEILAMLRSHGNLIVKSIESDVEEDKTDTKLLQMKKGIIRSGQTLSVEGNLLFFGDVNPGGTVIATGDIYVMGAIKGMAHAGVEGDEEAVVAASLMRPTQLRIASIISRPPDEWELSGDAYMEFAYLKEGQMKIDKLIHLHRIRPGAAQFKGE